MTRRSLMLGSALVAFATPAVAQQAQTGTVAASADKVAGALDDIVVTARRREETAQTVPVSITAVGETALTERTVRSLGDLTTLAPGIRFVQQGGGSNMNVVLRGLSRVPIGDAPNAVITYFADIPLVFVGSNIPTFDLGSIQVYKGPQGTLFGRNAIAGAVVITPQAPTYEQEGYFKLGGGNFNFKAVEAAFNLPIIQDKLALRVAGRVQRRDGTTENLGIGPDFDNIHTDSFRASLLFEPIDNLRNVTVFDYLRADEAGSVGILSKVLPQGLVRTPALAGAFDCHSAVGAANCGTTFSPDRDIDDALVRQQQIGPHKVYSGEANSRLFRKIYGVANRTELRIGDITVRNIFGFRHTDNKFTDFETDGVNFNPTLFTGTLWTAHRQISDEVSVLGKAFDDRLDFIAGGIYIKEDPFGGQGGRFQAVGRNAPWVEAYNTKKNKAVYGQLGFKLLSNVKLNAGYRYNKDTSNACTVVVPISATGGVPAAAPPAGPDNCPTTAGRSLLHADGTASTYTLGADWQVTRRVFAYVTTRRGYREGGVNYPAFNTPCTTGIYVAPTPGVANSGCLVTSPPDLRPFQSYEPETLTDYEIGVKTDWHVGGVTGRFNVSAYTGKYSNVQTAFNTSAVVRSQDSAAPQSSSLAINTGSRRLTGFEAELVVRPFRSLSITNGTAYTKQKVLEAPTTPFAGAQAPALDGVSPKWSTSTAVRWVAPVEPFGAELVLNADYYYQTSYFVANAKLPSYDVTNLRIDANHVGGSSIDVGFFMRNVFNQNNAVAGAATTNTLGIYTFSYAEPRVYGLEVKFSF